MIYNDGTSELQIRLHIAEMLKDKVEQPNYSELCEKALKFVLDGIELPKFKKTPAEEAADMFTKTFLFANPLQDALKELGKGDLPKPKEEKQKLFDAIKENGYHWNSETKTLEKLPKFKVEDREVLDNLIENIMGKKDMSLADYQLQAMTTCMSSCDNYSYMFLNLVGEVGELASKVSKAIRTGHANINENKLDFESINLKQEMMLEAGDVLWQLSGLCSAMGWPLEEIAQMNLDKLKSRQERGVIAGNGDHR